MSRNSATTILVSALLTFIFLVSTIPPSDDFSPYNRMWNGYSVLYRKHHARILGVDITADELIDSPRNYTLVVVPYKEPTAQELSLMGVFASLGGNLVIADDKGYGNDILSSLALNAEFDHLGAIADPVFYDKNYMLPYVFPIGGNRSLYIIANYASTISIRGGCERVLVTSKLAFFDENLDGTWQPGEPEGPLTVGAKCSYIGGTVYLLSDPDLLNNYAFENSNATYLLQVFARNRTIVIFYDLLPRSPYSDMFYITEKTLNILEEYIFVVVTVLALLAMLILRKTFPRGRR